MKFKKRTALYLLILIIVIITLLVGLLYSIQLRTNRENAYRSSTLLIDQLKNVINTNDDKVRSLTASLKDDYVTRAKAVSYIIDKDSTIEKQITELAWLTNLFSIDEIHLFDTEGTLYSGTKPNYYNENLKTSERFGAFQKMLTEKNFTMCQSVTDETGGSMQMMYAVCWNDAHTHLVMVGVEPMRLLNELATSQMDAVIKEIPAYEGIEILIANDSDNTIIGATTPDNIDRNLTDLDITISGDEKINHVYNQTGTILGVESYCSLARYDKYKIVIAQSCDIVNQNVPIPLILVSIYMLIAAVVIILIVRRMTKRVLNEHNKANSDAMTSFANRRAFETDIRRYDNGNIEPTLAFVSLDLNGLKRTNDSLGHEAGDRLIIGAANCIRQCFGNYGELYRVGGDEFVALIYADLDRLTKIKMDFAEELDNWSKENDMFLSISYGIVRAAEDPSMTFAEIAKLADDRMYKNKDEFYQKMNLAR
ncbi:MAG: GGDEF domain-containing protein [Eubacterium sp.]|nr:GGDEF domain-containing protein [Eubacterium sp.]